MYVSPVILLHGMVRILCRVSHILIVTVPAIPVSIRIINATKYVIQVECPYNPLCLLDNHTLLYTAEFVPCPVLECNKFKQEIIQQPADLTTLAPYLLNSAVTFIQTSAGIY